MNIFKVFLAFAFVLSASKLHAQVQFQRLIGGSDHERAQKAFRSANGGYIVNGATFSFGSGDVDAMLVGTDSLGQMLWSNTYGTPVFDNSEFAIQASDGGIVCVGRSNIQSGFPAMAMIYKTDSLGNLLWSRQIGSGSGNNNLAMAIETSNGNYAATGYSESFSAGATDVLLVITTANGDSVLLRKYGGIEAEEGRALLQMPDGGFLITGRQKTFPSGIERSDGLLIRTDATGNLLWTKTYGDSLWEELAAVALTSDSGIILAGASTYLGNSGYDILLMKTDYNGDLLWSKLFGGGKTDASYDIHVDANQSFVLSGYTESYGYGHENGNDSTNIFLLKTDSAGQLLWMMTYGNGLQDEAFKSSLAGDGGYLITGFTTNYILTDSTQMMFIKTDNAGRSGCHELPAQPADSSIILPVNSVAFTQSGQLSISSITLTQTTITPDVDDACLFARIEYPDHQSNSLSVFPNPSSGLVTVEYSNEAVLFANVSITDLAGRKVYFSESADHRHEFNVSGLRAGVYVLSVVVEDRSMRTKLIVSH